MSAFGGTQSWIDSRGGVFSDASNWQSAVPQSFDTAQFDLDSQYMVTFDQDVTTQNLNIRLGDVLFDLGGLTYTLSTAAGDHIRIAEVTGKPATLRITNGTLSDIGARVGVGGTGTLIIDGPDAHLSLTNFANAGYTTPGHIILQNGGTLTASAGLIGLITDGSATVTGKGSKWTSATLMSVGGPSLSFNALLNVVDGGLVVSPSVDISRSGRVTGNSILQTNLNVKGGGVSPGGAGQTATLTVDGNFAMASDVLSNLSIEMGGTAADDPILGFDALYVTGSAALNYKLNVALINGCSPPRGWVFDIVTAGVRTGTFSQIALPGLPNGGAFTVQYLADRLRLIAPGQLGDANGDDLVNVDDLLSVINAWGTCAPLGAGCAGDVNGTGFVDVDDVLLVINNWN